MSRQISLTVLPAKALLARGLLVAALALTGLTAACDEAEQDRPLQYKKGSYQGAPDSVLTEEQLNELRQRGRLQSGN